MEFLIMILTLWILFLTVKTHKQSYTLDEIQKTLSKFRVVNRDKDKTQVPEMSTSDTQSVIDPEPQVVVSPTNTNRVEIVVDTDTDKVPSQSFEQLLIKKILPTVGVLSVMLGIGFFVTWSYNNNWFGPGTLIAIGVLFSCILVGVGEYMRAEYPRYYAFLSASGMLGLSICVYSSHQVYHFIGDSLAFVSYSAIVLSTFAFALRYNNRMLSFLAGVGSFAVPFLVHTAEPNSNVLIAYSVVVFVGGALIMRYRGWLETGVATFLSLVAYAWMLLDATQATGTSYAVEPMLYMAWIYGALGLFAWAVIGRAMNEESGWGMSRDSIGMIAILMISTVIINVYGHEVFRNLGWEHFGFFVLLQGVGMYLVSAILARGGLERYRQLFMVGAMTSTVFATFYEVGGTLYPLAQLLLLAAQSAIFMTASRNTEGGMSKVFCTGAIIVQLIALTEIDYFYSDFTNMSIGMFALTVLALYNARMIFESVKQTVNWLVGIELFLASVLFLVWNFDLLPQELDISEQEILPYAISLAVVGALMAMFIVRRHRYLVVVSALLGTCSAIFFVSNIYDAEGTVLLGFIAVLMGLYAPLGFIEYLRKQDDTIESDTYRSTLTYSATALGALLVWFGFWWFSEPLSTLFMALVGVMLVVIGLLREHNSTRMVGLIIVGLLLSKLYLVDIWSWSTFWKFVAFLPVGLALISLPFWYQKLTTPEE